MSRNATPIIGPSDSGPCINIFAISAGYVVDGGGTDSDHPVRHLHVLIDLTRIGSGPASTAALSGEALNAVEYFASGLDAESACHFLSHLWNQATPTQAHLVFALPRQGNATAAAAWQLSDVARRLQGDSALAIVGVAPEPQSWADDGAIQHFVAAPEPFRFNQAVKTVFKLFAALSAPIAFGELDTADILAHMGTAHQPSHVFDVAWHLPGWDVELGTRWPETIPEAGSMGAIAPHENRSLFAAEAILACPMWSVIKPKLLVDALFTELTQFVPPDIPVVVASTDGFWGPQTLPHLVGRMAFLCKPA